MVGLRGGYPYPLYCPLTTWPACWSLIGGSNQHKKNKELLLTGFSFGRKLPYADLEKRRENVRRWKRENSYKVRVQKRRNRAKHVDRENENSRPGGKKIPKKSRLQKYCVDKRRNSSLWAQLWRWKTIGKRATHSGAVIAVIQFDPVLVEAKDFKLDC